MIEEIKITSLSGRGSLSIKKGEYWNYWLGPVDWGQVQGQHQTYSYPTQVGESIVSTTIQSRPLSITGWVVDAVEGTLQSRCDFLNAFISPVEDYTLEYKGKKINFRPDISVAYSPEYKKNNEKVRRFLIQGTCPFPLFSDSSDSVVSMDQTRKTFRFPNNFGRIKPVVFAVIGKSYVVEADNKGGFATGVIIRAQFSAEVRNPRFKNLTTDTFIGVNRTFRRGELLEISTLPSGKYMKLWRDDGTVENVIKYRDFQTAWFQLIPGTNRLAIECDDLNQRGNMDVNIYYTPLYMVVQ